MLQLFAEDVSITLLLSSTDWETMGQKKSKSVGKKRKETCKKKKKGSYYLCDEGWWWMNLCASYPSFPAEASPFYFYCRWWGHLIPESFVNVCLSCRSMLGFPFAHLYTPACIDITHNWNLLPRLRRVAKKKHVAIDSSFFIFWLSTQIPLNSKEGRRSIEKKKKEKATRFGRK